MGPGEQVAEQKQASLDLKEEVVSRQAGGSGREPGAGETRPSLPPAECCNPAALPGRGGASCLSGCVLWALALELSGFQREAERWERRDSGTFTLCALMDLFFCPRRMWACGLACTGQVWF